MTKTIVQKVIFKNTTAATLYNLYMDAKKHSQATGGPAKIKDEVGTKYSAHGGWITGKNLHLVKNKMIVQTWRGKDWNKEDQDSVFIIKLEPKGKDTILHATHANVPEKSVDGIKKGWNDHYWNHWKEVLAGKPITPVKM